jgi:hypothetical protein
MVTSNVAQARGEVVQAIYVYRCAEVYIVCILKNLVTVVYNAQD